MQDSDRVLNLTRYQSLTEKKQKRMLAVLRVFKTYLLSHRSCTLESFVAPLHVTFTLRRLAIVFARSLLFALFSFAFVLPVVAAPGGIEIKSIVAIKHASDPLWSPDGRLISYIWDEGGYRNIYVVSALGGEPTRLTDFNDTANPHVFWSTDGKTLFFEHAGGLWQADPSRHQAAHPAALITAKGFEFTASPDGSRLAWVLEIRPRL